MSISAELEKVYYHTDHVKGIAWLHYTSNYNPLRLISVGWDRSAIITQL